jgi:hypothetical protein
MNTAAALQAGSIPVALYLYSAFSVLRSASDIPQSIIHF